MPRRRETLLVAVLLALLAACGVVYLVPGPSPLPVGHGAAGDAVPPAPFAKPWVTTDVVLLGIGDSITRGYGASPGHSYVELLVRNDDGAYPDMRGRDLAHALPKLCVVNLSVNYTTSAEHLASQVRRLEKHPPDVQGIAVITTGGNDLIHDYGRTPPRDGALYGCTAEQAEAWCRNFRTRLDAILDGVEAAFPGGCHIFLANIYDPTDGVGDIEKADVPLPPWPDGLRALALFNEAIADACAARDRVHLVDIHRLFLGHGLHCRDKANPHYREDDPHYWYFANLEDPSDRGYDAIRRAVLKEMARVFVAPRRERTAR